MNANETEEAGTSAPSTDAGYDPGTEDPGNAGSTDDETAPNNSISPDDGDPPIDVGSTALGNETYSTVYRNTGYAVNSDTGSTDAGYSYGVVFLGRFLLLLFLLSPVLLILMMPVRLLIILLLVILLLLLVLVIMILLELFPQLIMPGMKLEKLMILLLMGMPMGGCWS